MRRCPVLDDPPTSGTRSRFVHVGTNGDPKGVVHHHRGAYLNAVCNAANWNDAALSRRLPLDLAMFIATLVLPWKVAMLGVRHICLRKVDAVAILAGAVMSVSTTTARRDRHNRADRAAPD